MLASLPDDELDERLAGIADLPVLTARSHRTVDELRRDLELTRERGHSLDDGQNTEGVACIGVAVPGSAAATPPAVSATLLAVRLTDEMRESLVADLTSLARSLAQAAAI